MRPSTESMTGRAVVVMAHTAGMIDLVALPLWIGGLIGSRGFSPGQAGLLVTCYILGLLLCSLVAGPRFGRVDSRLVSACPTPPCT